MYFHNGYLRIQISGDHVSRFLNLCVYHEITLWDLCVNETGYECNLYLKDFFQIKGIVKKTKCNIKILEKKGFLFWIKKQAKKKLLLLGPFLCLFLLWILSNLLWSVKIVGNERMTDEVLQDFLQEQGVHYGMLLNKVPTKEIKTNLRLKYDYITWTSASLKGTTLEIRIKENDVEIPKQVNNNHSDILAPKDGLVHDIYIRQGTAVVKKGDEVKKGDVLIEGKVVTYNEDGTIKKEHFCNADGEVWIQYSLPIKENLNWIYEKKSYSGLRKTKYYMQVGQQKLGVDIRKIPFLMYDVIEEKQTSVFLEQLPIPIILYKNIYRDYRIENRKYTPQEANTLLRNRFEKIIERLEEKGVQIIEKNVKIVSNSVSVSMCGTLTIRECCKLQQPSEDVK